MLLAQHLELFVEEEEKEGKEKKEEEEEKEKEGEISRPRAWSRCKKQTIPRTDSAHPSCSKTQAATQACWSQALAQRAVRSRYASSVVL
jgi:hypothetical protein